MQVAVYFRSTNCAIEHLRTYPDVKRITINSDNTFELHLDKWIAYFGSGHYFEIQPNRLQVREIRRGVFVDDPVD